MVSQIFFNLFSIVCWLIVPWYVCKEIIKRMIQPVFVKCHLHQCPVKVTTLIIIIVWIGTSEKTRMLGQKKQDLRNPLQARIFSPAWPSERESSTSTGAQVLLWVLSWLLWIWSQFYLLSMGWIHWFQALLCFLFLSCLLVGHNHWDQPWTWCLYVYFSIPPVPSFDSKSKIMQNSYMCITYSRGWCNNHT